MSVAVLSRQRWRGVRIVDVRSDARSFLQALGVDGELSVALVNDAEIKQLNARYRRIDRPTDVLSFGATADAVSQLPPSRVLGDVVISVETAARQAAAQGDALADEVRFLLVHGVLHLLGYDHERSPADAKRMFAKQRQLIAMRRRQTRQAGGR